MQHHKVQRPATWVAKAWLPLVILLAAALWRLLLCWLVVPWWETSSNIAPTPDAYPTLARSLLHQHVLSYLPLDGQPTTARGPGFPAWLALGMLIGGEDPRWLGFWGGLPGLLLGALVANLAARRFGMMAGAVSATVAVAHPLPSLIAARVMGDDFYAALGCAGLLAWNRVLQKDGQRRARWWVALAGALIGLQMLTRSTGLLTLLAALLVCLWLPGSRLRHCLLLALIALTPPLLWSLRSSTLEGRPVFVHSLFFYNFWVGEGLDRYGAGEPPAGNWDRIVSDVYRQADWPTEGHALWYGTLEPRRMAELESRLGRAAVLRIRHDPLGYIGRCARGLFRFWFQAGTSRRTQQYLAVVLPVLFLAALGSWKQAVPPGRRNLLGTLFLLTIVLHNVAYAVVLPAARLSVQVYPELAYLAGAGAAYLLGRWTKTTAATSPLV